MVSCQNTSKRGSNPSLVFPKKAMAEIADILWENAPDGVQHENKLKYLNFIKVAPRQRRLLL